MAATRNIFTRDGQDKIEIRMTAVWARSEGDVKKSSSHRGGPGFSRLDGRWRGINQEGHGWTPKDSQMAPIGRLATSTDSITALLIRGVVGQACGRAEFSQSPKRPRLRKRPLSSRLDRRTSDRAPVTHCLAAGAPFLQIPTRAHQLGLPLRGVRPCSGYAGMRTTRADDPMMDMKRHARGCAAAVLTALGGRLSTEDRLILASPV